MPTDMRATLSPIPGMLRSSTSQLIVPHASAGRRRRPRLLSPENRRHRCSPRARAVLPDQGPEINGHRRSDPLQESAWRATWPILTSDERAQRPAALAERVLILDFGAQYTQLIARRVRENGVYSEILPCTADAATIRAFAPKAIILSGGPASTTETAAPRAPDAVFELGVPILGICYGEQTICAQLGGKVEIAQHREFGRAFIDVVDRCALFEGLFEPGARAQVWMSHGDKVVELPPGFRVVATSEASPFAAIADDARQNLRRPVPPRGRAHARRQRAC